MTGRAAPRPGGQDRPACRHCHQPIQRCGDDYAGHRCNGWRHCDGFHRCDPRHAEGDVHAEPEAAHDGQDRPA